MAKQRITDGAILEINIDSQYYVYAQILTKGLGCAFFDLKSKLKIQDLTLLQKASIHFIVTVYSDIMTQGVWVKVGKLPIRNDLLDQPPLIKP